MTTTRRKLIAGYVALVAVSAVVVGVSVVMDGRVRRDVIDVSTHAHAEVLGAHRLSSAVLTVGFRLRELATARERDRTSGPASPDLSAVAPGAKAESALRMARADLDASLIAMQDAARTAPEPSVDRAAESASARAAEQEELQLLAELQAEIDHLEHEARRLDSAVETMSSEEVQRAVGALLTSLHRRVTPGVQRVMEDAENEMASAASSFAGTMRDARRIEMAAVMAVVLLTLIVGTFTDRAQSVLQNFNDALETVVKERTAQLQQVIDVAPFGASLYALQPGDRLVFVAANRSADRILHVDTRQYIGKTIEEAFPAIANTTIPARCRSAARDGISQHVGPIAYNEGGINGSFDLHLVPLGPNRMAIFFRDITELVHAYDETLAGWSRAMDVRDKETEGHTQRVTEMTIALARAMGVSETDLVHIRWGALLHDIGKIGVPDNILHKPGPLTEEEWVIMRRHPEIARDMLAPIAFLKRAMHIPYCHHERWDGSGYPRGLRGEQIPLAARIFAVADVWDALRSHRPYHRAWPAEEARAYIHTHAGDQFDPAVVEAFEALLTAKPELAEGPRREKKRAG